jgi:ATP-dependent Clp protease adaptor protein ClpS
MSKSDNSTILEKKSKTQIQEPKKYAVFLLNDNYTTFEFVVEVLVTIFNKSYQEAQIITLEIHKKQKGMAGVFMKEIAESKSKEVQSLAKSRKHPLRSRVESV